MKYVTIFHSILGIWIAVPSIYLEVVQKYCVVITERELRGWRGYYAYLMADDCLLRLPGSFVSIR